MDATGRLLTRIASIGGRLRIVGGSLKYEGPAGRLTQELREEIRHHKTPLVARLRRPVAELVGQLSAAGLWFRIEDEWPSLEAGDAAELDIAEEVVDELVGREEELVAFLRKTEAEMTDAELDALDCRRPTPGAPILRGPDDPEPASWSPPPGWGRVR